ncbi:MAG: TolC family outer membrane protein [Rhodocyclaceae bacterium]|nr:TolC family outer membrane protein [Rhodocyclaceae bacterium]
MDLLTVYRKARENDANYLAARATAEAGRELLPQARAALLPNVSASMARSRNSTDQRMQSLLGADLHRQYDYIAESQALTVRQPLFRPAQWAAYRQAEAKVAGVEAALAKETGNLGWRVTQAYVETLAARERLSSLDSQREALQAQRMAAERALALGFGTRTDVDDAQARLDAVDALRVEAQQRLLVAERQLAALIGEEIAASRLVGLPPTPDGREMAHSGTFEEWLSRAETGNAELRALAAAVEAAEHDLARNRAGHMPTLDLVASRSKSDSDSNTTIGSRYWTSSIGIQLAIPLYAGGYVDSTVRQAAATLESVRQQYEAARRQLAVEVAKAYAMVVYGRARIRAQEQAVRSAEESLRSTRKGVEAGTRNQVDVLDAQQRLSNARYDLYQARLDHLLGWLRLRYLAGSLEEDEISEANRWLAAQRN